MAFNFSESKTEFPIAEILLTASFQHIIRDYIYFYFDKNNIISFTVEPETIGSFSKYNHSSPEYITINQNGSIQRGINKIDCLQLTKLVKKRVLEEGLNIPVISDFLIRGKRGCMVFSHRTMPVRASCRPFATPCQGR